MTTPRFLFFLFFLDSREEVSLSEVVVLLSSLSLSLLLLLSLLPLSSLLGSLGLALLTLCRGLCSLCGVTGAARCLFVVVLFHLAPAVRGTAAAAALFLPGAFCPFFVVAIPASLRWNLFHSCRAAAFTRGSLFSWVALTAKMLVLVSWPAQHAVATQPQNDRYVGI